MSRLRLVLAVVALLVVAALGVTIGRTLLDGPPGSSASTMRPVGGAARSTHVNGQIPGEELVAIDGTHRLLEPAAQAFAGMAAAAAEDGHALTVNSAYRDLDEQQALIERYGLLEDGGRAAPLGESEHGEGTCVDLTLDYDALSWMRQHAAAHGFAETIADEPWHWNWVPR